MEFRLNRLVEYSDEQILAEIRRVASLVLSKSLTHAEFARHARVSKNTVKRRFGSWKDALVSAGLAERYSGVSVTDSMRFQEGKTLTDEEVLERVKSVAKKLGRDSITVDDFNEHSGIEANTVRRRFGSWKIGLTRAGLSPVNMGKRYSDEECFENLLAVWMHYGRPPKYQEMSMSPSVVGPKAYIIRWRTWTRALHAFAERVNIETDETLESKAPVQQKIVEPGPIRLEEEDQRIRLGLRYKVLVRDQFKCRLCGGSPAIDPQCRLHVDHIVPWSKGGKTTFENLRTLCEQCNLGKGNSMVELQEPEKLPIPSGFIKNEKIEME